MYYKGNMDKPNGVKINSNMTIGEMISFWMFGTVREKNIIAYNIFNNKCLKLHLKLEECIKENKDCQKIMEELGKCKRGEL